MNGTANIDEKVIEEIRKGNDDIKLFIGALEVRLSLKIEEINRKVVHLEEENEQLKSKVEELERQNRKNNIIVFGVEREEPNLNVDSVIQQLNNVLDINVTLNDLNNIYPIGKNRNAPLKVEFTSFLKKREVLKKTKNLKGTKLSIAHDLTVKQREIQKILKKHLKIQRENKENNSFIRGDKLFVNGHAYEACELLELESTEITEREVISDPGTPSPPEFVPQQSPPVRFHRKEALHIPEAPKSDSTRSDSKAIPSQGQSTSKKPSGNTKKDELSKIQVTPKKDPPKTHSTGYYKTRNNSGNRKVNLN